MGKFVRSFEFEGGRIILDIYDSVVVFNIESSNEYEVKISAKFILWPEELKKLASFLNTIVSSFFQTTSKR